MQYHGQIAPSCPVKPNFDGINIEIKKSKLMNRNLHTKSFTLERRYYKSTNELPFFPKKKHNTQTHTNFMPHGPIENLFRN